MEELVLTGELIELCSLNCLLFEIYSGKPPGTQASIIRCLSQARIHWEGCGKKGIQRKKWGMMEVGALIVWMGCHPDGLLVRLPLLSFPAP